MQKNVNRAEKFKSNWKIEFCTEKLNWEQISSLTDILFKSFHNNIFVASALFSSLEENDTIASINLSSSDGLNRNKLSAAGVEPLESILRSNCTL